MGLWCPKPEVLSGEDQGAGFGVRAGHGLRCDLDVKN